ncbi:nuclear transport factor 2 family protein [Microbacterium saperdae]|jgi:hypothetical protein|uniref:SnoaL-like protein n=1 Tax=Microbacterium saperdae TaxID=69368 RepID=A0A543BB51_9MICO|nr:nuclear transport factor 2 family protein [Microbacterium saperdae]TQL82069.1 SnoaL-like protein [Microbacterium saperdae]GGM36953.1 hypothetical protein GCM10010489_04880 [Microbacterium saperdae]
MTESLPPLLADFIESVNAHDAEAFIAAFATDGVVDDWGREFVGPEAIVRWSDREFIGSAGTLRVISITRHGQQTVVVGDWRSTHANGVSAFTFDVAGDKISRMTIREG